MPAVRQDTLLLRLLKDVNDIKANLRRVVATLPLYDIDNENTPAQITTDQNNYDPGNYDTLRLASDASRSITGIARGVKGRMLHIFNVGDHPIILENQHASSDAENRFKFSTGLDVTAPPNSNVLIYYDSTDQRWIGGDPRSSGPVFSLVVSNDDQTIPDSVWTKLDIIATSSYDPYSMHDPSNHQYVIKFSGFYDVIATAIYQAHATAGVARMLFIYRNGAFNGGITIPNIANIPMVLNSSIKFYFSVGDTISFYVFHAAGGADLDITSVITAVTGHF